MNFLIALMAAGLLLPASAGAVTLVNPDGTRAEPFQTWANRAKVRTVDETVTVYRDQALCGLSAFVWGCASQQGWVVVDAPNGLNRRTLLHELGHMYDFAFPSGWRDKEAFADAYVKCALNPIRRTPRATRFCRGLSSSGQATPPEAGA